MKISKLFDIFAVKTTVNNKHSEVPTSGAVVDYVGLVFISSSSPSAASSLQFASLSSAYRYRMVWRYKQNTSAGRINIRINGDTGGNYDDAFHEFNKDGVVSGGGTTNTLMNSGNTQPQADYWVMGSLEFSAASADDTIVHLEISQNYSNAKSFHYQGYCKYSGASAISTIDVFPEIGTITGKFDLYRYKS